MPGLKKKFKQQYKGALDMAKVYVNIHSGPDLKNKETLGLLIAVTA